MFQNYKQLLFLKQMKTILKGPELVKNAYTNVPIKDRLELQIFIKNHFSVYR